MAYVEDLIEEIQRTNELLERQIGLLERQIEQDSAFHVDNATYAWFAVYAAVVLSLIAWQVW